MNAKDGFNIDELQSQIHDAESYLQSSIEVRRSLRSSINGERPDARASLNDTQKEEKISESYFPVPKRPSEFSDPKEPEQRVPTNQINHLHANEINSSSSGRYSHPAEREALIDRLLNDHKQRKAQRVDLLNHPKAQVPSVNITQSRDHVDQELSIDAPYKSIRFGSEDSLGEVKNSETPSLFRIMQSNQPVDVGEMLGNFTDSKISRGSPDSLNDQQNLAATIRFTKTLNTHEKFMNDNESNSDDSMNSKEDLFKNSDYDELPHYSSNPSDGEAENTDSFPRMDRQSMHRYAAINSLHSSVDTVDYEDSNRRQTSNVRPATSTPLSQRPTTLRSQSRSRSRSPTSTTIVRRNNRDALLKQAEEEFKKTHTFAPQLYKPKTKTGGKVEESVKPLDDSNKPKYRPDRIQELHEEYLEKCRERERLKYEFEKVDMIQCTFKPTINRRSMSPSRKILEQYDDSDAYRNHAASRLHEDAAERARRKHFLAEQIHQEEMMQYTFQPQVQINPRYRVDDRPIHERLAELQKERQRHLNHLRQSYEQERSVSFTFQPVIDQKSRSLAEDKAMKDITNTILEAGGEFTGVEEAYRVLDRDRDVGKRLMEESIRLKRKKQQLLYERERELSLQMEPTKISKGSKKIIQSNNDIQADFDTRMNQHEQRVKATKEAKIREEDAKHQSWFKPALEESTVKIIEKHRPEILQETPRERARRLSVEDQREMQNHKKQLEKSIYGSITYTPHIDPISKLFGRKSSIQDLHENPRGKQAQTWAKVKAERAVEEECTFQPQINLKSKKMVEPTDYDYVYRKYHNEFPSTLGYEENATTATDATHNKSLASHHSSRLQRINFEEPERMLMDIRQRAIEKEEARRQAIIAKEIDELQECSFQPSFVTRYRPESMDDEPIVIRGLGRHMELRDMAMKIKEENQEREFKAFHVVNAEKYRRPEDGSTIVQPFELELERRERERRRR